jgi:hypothetical protein
MPAFQGVRRSALRNDSLPARVRLNAYAQDDKFLDISRPCGVASVNFERWKSTKAVFRGMTSVREHSLKKQGTFPEVGFLI